MTKRLGCFLSISLLCNLSNAVEVSLLGGLDQGTQITNAGLTPSSQSNGFGGGGYLSFPLGSGKPPFSLDIGVLYLQRPVEYSVIGTPGSLEYIFPNLMVPLTLRTKFFGFLMLRAGPYLSYGIGNISYVSTIAGVPSASRSYESLFQNRLDYGILAGGGLDIQILSWLAIFAEVNGIMGLSDIDTTIARVSYLDVVAFGGLRFNFSGKK